MLKKIATTFVTKFLTALINMLIVIIISQLTGAEGKGIHGIFMATLGMSVTITAIFGIIPLSYLVPQNPSINYFYIANSWAIISSFVLYFSLPAFNLIDKELALMLSIITLFSSLSNINLSVFLIKEKITSYNLLNFSQPLINIVILIILYLFRENFTIGDYFQSLLLSYFILFVISTKGFIAYASKTNRLNVKELRGNVQQMFRYGILNQLATLIQMISFRGSFYILEKYGSIHDVGIFSNAVSIAESVWIINRSLSFVFYSRVINSKSKTYHRRLYLRYSFLAFWFQILALVFLVIIPNSFYVRMFGEDFQSMKLIIMFMLPASFFFGQSLLAGHYFSGTGRHQINLYSNTASTIITISLCYALIPQYSTIGAALATNIGYIGLILINNFYLRKYIGINIWSRIFHLKQVRILLKRQ